MRTTKGLAFALIVIGIGFNLLDAYFSGNLPFSPASSASDNKVSVLNRLGQGVNSPVWKRLGTILAAIGAGIFLLGYFRKR